MSLAAVLALGAIGAPLAVGHASGGETATQAATTYLTTGSSGPQVTAVQNALGVNASGYFDKATHRAVTSFQTENGLLVDGIVGPQTSAALGLAGASTPEQSAPQPEEPQQRSAPSGQSSGGGQSSSGESSSGSGQSSSGESSSSGGSGGGSAPSGVLQQIAQCESGGDPSAVNGVYRGKYQFTRETWAGVGGSGDPAQASEAEQDRRAAQLLTQQGTSPWANCAG